MSQILLRAALGPVYDLARLNGFTWDGKDAECPWCQVETLHVRTIFRGGVQSSWFCGICQESDTTGEAAPLFSTRPAWTCPDCGLTVHQPACECGRVGVPS